MEGLGVPALDLDAVGPERGVGQALTAQQVANRLRRRRAEALFGQPGNQPVAFVVPEDGLGAGGCEGPLDRWRNALPRYAAEQGQSGQRRARDGEPERGAQRVPAYLMPSCCSSVAMSKKWR